MLVKIITKIEKTPVIKNSIITINSNRHLRQIKNSTKMIGMIKTEIPITRLNVTKTMIIEILEKMVMDPTMIRNHVVVAVSIKEIEAAEPTAVVIDEKNLKIRSKSESSIFFIIYFNLFVYFIVSEICMHFNNR